MPQPVLNLSNVAAVIVDGDKYLLTIISQILRGFGLTRQFHFTNGEDAKDFLSKNRVDLCIFEQVLPDMNGDDLVRWLRRNPNSKLRFTPVLTLTGYTHVKSVHAARDSGANLVVKKPMSPQTLFDHIVWLSNSDRPFVEGNGYVGPDRRWRIEKPEDAPARRAGDEQEAEPGASSNLSSPGASAQ
jgi:two-component system chemotaxis response regulator CheY